MRVGVDEGKGRVPTGKGYSDSSSPHGPCCSQWTGIALVPWSDVIVANTEEVNILLVILSPSPLLLRAAAAAALALLLEKGAPPPEESSVVGTMAPPGPELAPLVRQEMALARFRASE